MHKSGKSHKTVRGISFRCRALFFGDNVNTDLIHSPSEFSIDTAKLSSGLVGSKLARVAPGKDARKSGGQLQGEDKILLAGENFGLGSSRFSTVAALKNDGVRCVASLSLARIFERNLASAGIFPLTICGNDNIKFREYIDAGKCLAAGVKICAPVAGSDYAAALLELETGGGKSVLIEACAASLLYEVAASGGMVDYIAGN